MFRNRMANLARMGEDSPMSALRGAYRGVPAVLVASGPSLDRSLEALRTIRDRAVIICADSAAMPLLENGVTPHYVATVDFNDFTFDKIAGIDLSESSMLYIPESTPRSFGAVVKHRYYTYLSSFYKTIFDGALGVECPAIHNVRSCTHLAHFAAMYMGCDPIIFVAHDFKYENGRDHATGVRIDWGNSHADDINQGLLGIREVTNAYITNNRHIRHINATDGGLDIEAPRMALAEAIKEYCAGSINHPEAPGPGRVNLPFVHKMAHESKRNLSKYFLMVKKGNHRKAVSLCHQCDNDPAITSMTDYIFGRYTDQYFASKLRIKIAKPSEIEKAVHDHQVTVQAMRQNAINALIDEMAIVRKEMGAIWPSATR